MLNLERKNFRGRALPEVVPADIQNLVDRGYATMGIIAFFLTDSGEVLMIRHAKSSKNNDGELGPLGETAEAVFDGDRGLFTEVEQPTQSLIRGLIEELGVAPESIEHRGYFLADWEIGDGRGKALAVCPVIDCGDGSWIPRSPKTDEARETVFMRPEEILALPDKSVRLGVKALTEELQDFLSQPTEIRRTIRLRPLQLRLGQWEDLDLARAAVKLA